MAGEDRKQTDYIEDELLQDARSFSFFQTMRLLKYFCSKENKGQGKLNTDVDIANIKIEPHLSLAFPTSDVARVEKNEKTKKYKLVANILGLYGTCSPLPTFYTEELFDDISQGNNTTKDFIDVINHRLYELLFAGWTKYKGMQKIVEEKSSIHTSILFSLIGMSETELRQDFENPFELLRYTGLFAIGPRSASGLETILADAMGNLKIKIIQGVERKGVIPEDQRAVLGACITLGVNSQLGNECLSSSGAFRIEIGPVNDREYRSLFPGEKNHKKLVALTNLYLSQPFEYDLEVILNENEKPGTICLGGEKCSSLGFDTWTYSDKGLEKDAETETKTEIEVKEFRAKFYPDKVA